MRLTLKIVSLVLILVLWVGPGSAKPEMITQSWQAKIDGEVLSAIAEGETLFSTCLIRRISVGLDI
jgi:hypothetical protein